MKQRAAFEPVYIVVMALPQAYTTAIVKFNSLVEGRFAAYNLESYPVAVRMLEPSSFDSADVQKINRKASEVFATFCIHT